MSGKKAKGGQKNSNAGASRPSGRKAKKKEVFTNPPDSMQKVGLPAKRSESSIAKVDPLQRYLMEIRRYELLSREEEHDLAVEYTETQDPLVAHRLVSANLRLVVKIAMDYRKYWMNLLDLVQEGNVGLMQAVKRYDPYRGVKLSSYSSFWIKAYILKFIIDNWSLVKIGTTQAERKLFFNLKKEKEKYARLGFKADSEQIANDLNVKPELVVQMEQRMSGSDLSLDQPVSTESEDSHLDFLPSKEKDIDDELANREIQTLFSQKLREFRERLKDKDLDIFDNRLLAESPQTLSEIGERYGISRERIRQIQERLINKLRSYFLEEVPELANFKLASDHFD